MVESIHGGPDRGWPEASWDTQINIGDISVGANVIDVPTSSAILSPSQKVGQ